ncbi:hypothetical protein D3C78_1825260 [compost metagenome]
MPRIPNQPISKRCGPSSNRPQGISATLRGRIIPNNTSAITRARQSQWVISTTPSSVTRNTSMARSTKLPNESISPIMIPAAT